jgi:hypothetical protein
MTVQTLELAGKKFVIMSERDYRRLQQRLGALTEQDRGDVAEARRRAKTGRSRSYLELRKKLGLK